MDFWKMAAEASYIEERLSGEHFIWQEDERSEERLQAWNKLLNVAPGKRIFETRLEHAGITEKDALAFCGGASSHENQKLPHWAVMIETILNTLPADKEQLWDQIALNKEEIKLVGPISALLPFLNYSEEQLKKRFSDIPMRDLSDILLKRLYYLCSQTFNAQARLMMLVGQGSSDAPDQLWRKLEDNLLGGEWDNLLETYPVLAKRIGVTIEYFLAFIEEFLDRFSAKKEILAEHFFDGASIKQIEKIEGEISDLHQKGKSVLILDLDGERKLVYKPRPMEIDVAWEEFLTHFKTEKSSIKAPRCLDSGSFGFIEYIEHRECDSMEEIKTYFYNAGALMALLYAFGGNDFHMENIISSGTSPVVVDTETLMIPVARFFGKGGKDDPAEEDKSGTLEEIFDRSVIKMGFLPMWHKDGEDKRADYGALTGEKEAMKNLPVFRGKKYPGSDFSDEIAGGFRDMYRLIMSRRDELLSSQSGIRIFERCRFRMLIRNSQVYGNLLQHITQPAPLKDGFQYSMTTDRLVNAFLYEAHESIVPQLLKVFLSEKNAVERGDLPIFYGEPSGEGILDEEEMLFDHYFEKSAIANARERITKLNEEDLMIQLQIIERSLATEARDVHEYFTDADKAENKTDDQPLLSFEALLGEARGIFSEIMANRFTAKDGDYSWLSEIYDLMRSGTSLSVMGPSLYDGLLGLSVFSAALYRLTKEQEYYDTALHCYNKACRYLEIFTPTMERYQMNLGYSSGVAGYISGLSLTAEYLELEDGCETAEKLILGITQKMIREDTVYDVLGGISGLVLTLTRDDRWLKNGATGAHVREILKWCGDHLIDRQNLTTEKGFRVWKSKEASQPLTGLGHGVSGIALALIRLGRILGEERFLTAARDAVAYEDSVFDEESGNWPDFRNDSGEKGRTARKFMGGYCAGAPGIGLARLDGIKRVKNGDPFSAELVQDVQKSGPIYPVDQ